MTAHFMDLSGGDAGGGRSADRPAADRSLPEGIAQGMAEAGGRVTLARFMELALTHPIDGFYTRTGGQLGRRGHFTTVPCVCEPFCAAVVRLLDELVGAVSAQDTPSASPPIVRVVELGGGRGDIAVSLLQWWGQERPDRRGSLEYVIVEAGDGPREQQTGALSPFVKKGWRVGWAASVEKALSGRAPGGMATPAAVGLGAAPAVVVFGNEFIDALPVHVVDVRGPRPLEAHVRLQRRAEGGPREFEAVEEWGALSAEAAEELRAVLGATTSEEVRAETQDGFVELRPAARSLLEHIAGERGAGCLLTIDYGDWYCAARRPRPRAPGGVAESAADGALPASLSSAAPSPAPYRRTLRGYFRHQLVADPYVRVGRQDLTADVDFRALDLHGRALGFETVVFTTVAALLRGDSAESRLESLRGRAGASLYDDRQASILEELLDGDGLGGAFKVMLQVKG